MGLVQQSILYINVTHINNDHWLFYIFIMYMGLLFFLIGVSGSKISMVKVYRNIPCTI